MRVNFFVHIEVSVRLTNVGVEEVREQPQDAPHISTP
jgi:hypothetical protein